MLLHDKQKEIASSLARFKVIRAGRKGGKTAYERESIGYKAIASVKDMPYLAKTTFDTGRKVIYIAPTQSQARKIVWEALKNRYANVATFNEQQLEMKIQNVDNLYTTVYVGGWENRENYRGLTDVIHITFDETDSLRDFFVAWKDIFRPMFLDTRGSADFIGTPNKKNPNLKRLEKLAEGNPNYACFHFSSKDNPFLPRDEFDELIKEYDGDQTSYQQEILAEHVEDSGALFKYTALVDMFTNSITKSPEKYMTVDVADDGSDKTVFAFWQGLELYRLEQFSRLNTEGIVNQIREYAAEDRIPYSQIAVDAIGVGAGVASSSLLDGIVGYKSSYSAIKTDHDPTRLPNVHYRNNVSLTTEYANLRSQCIFILADLVNNHKIAARLSDVHLKEAIIEELATYQDASKGDGKRMATKKEEVKELLGRSPDLSDTLVMRMYFEVRERIAPVQSEQLARLHNEINNQFARNEQRSSMNNTK